MNTLFFGAISWLGTILLTYGLWLIGKKQRRAFIYTFLGEIGILIYSLHMRSSALVFIGLVFSGLAVRNWIMWGKE